MHELIMAAEIEEGLDVPSLYVHLEHPYYPYVKYTNKPQHTIIPSPVHPRAVEWCKKYNIPLKPHFDATLDKMGYRQSSFCVFHIVAQKDFEKLFPPINKTAFHKLKGESII